MKRVAIDQNVNGIDEPFKKRRTEDTDDKPHQKVIHVRQLKQLIAFDQNNIGGLVAGIKTLKSFLDGILYPDPESADAKTTSISILHELLDPAKRPKGQDAAPFLPDLIQAWRFASQTNNDTLLFSVTNIFALLMRTLSSEIEFRDHGAALCWTMLQREQLKLLSKGLCAESHKERIISPTLRLLTEMVSFDGGAWAARLFDRQDSTFNLKFMDRNLKLSRTTITQDSDDRRKQSVRGNAVKYLLALLRFLPPHHKVKLLEHRLLFRTLFEHLRHDPFYLVQDILNTLSIHVLEPDHVPRKLKSAIMSERCLSAILDTTRQPSTIKIKTFAFLTRVCTVQSLGVLLPSSWYPLNAVDEPDNETESTEIRNYILAKFLPSLRPHSDLEERALVLDIFRAAPELLSHHTLRMAESLSMDPILTITFVGYAAYFRGMIAIAPPAYFGNKDARYSPNPPSIVAMIENVLPLPLTQKILVKCLNQPVEMITLLAVQILITSILKLKSVLTMLSDAAQANDAYREPRQLLLAAYSRRFPSVKEIMTASRKCPDSATLLKEAFLRLRSLCLDVLPNVTNEEAVDVAASLSAHLNAVHSNPSPMRELHLQHLLSIAERTPGLQWWSKESGTKTTPFTALMMHHNRPSTSPGLRLVIRRMIKVLIVEHGILHTDEEARTESSIDALLTSLQPTDDFDPTAETWAFVDDCIVRCVKRPVAYLDMLNSLVTPRPDESMTLSLLAVVCMEQAPFTKRLSSGSMQTVLMWVSRFFVALQSVGESDEVLSGLRAQIASQGLKLRKSKVIVDVSAPSDLSPAADQTETIAKHETTTRLPVDTLEILTMPPPEKDVHPELAKFKNLDISSLLDDSALSALILDLSSAYPEIRTQSLSALRTILANLGNTSSSTEPRRDQVLLLIGELLETVSQAYSNDLSNPIPYVVTTFATHALRILVNDPASVLYPAINRYLLKDPSWRPKRQLKWWLDASLFVPGGPGVEPTAAKTESLDPDTFWARIAFVTGWMLDSLRTSRDVDMLLASRVMEGVLGMMGTAGLPRSVQDDVIAVIWRMICLSEAIPDTNGARNVNGHEGTKTVSTSGTVGATALVTSLGILSWLEARLLAGKIEREILRRLLIALRDNIDRVKVENWSAGYFEPEIQRLLALVGGKS